MNTRKYLGVLVTAGLALTACGSDDDVESSSPTAATADANSPTDSTGADDPAADGPATVMVATDPDLGEYLVDADGFTLYVFTKDQGTTTQCTGGCADNWPPIVADGPPTGGDGIDTAQLATAEGIAPNQVTYNGRLLYYFAGDQAAGDTNGVGLPDWFAVNPSGDAIQPG